MEKVFCLENEEVLDNEKLSKMDLVDYDLERTYYRVCKFMKKYRRLKSKNYTEPPIQITTKYKFIYVDERTKGINDYTELDEYIDNDREFSSEVFNALLEVSEVGKFKRYLMKHSVNIYQRFCGWDK